MHCPGAVRLQLGAVFRRPFRFFKSLGGVGHFRLGFRLPAHRQYHGKRRIQASPARQGKKQLTIIYRRFIIVPFLLFAAFLAPQEIAGEDTMLAALYVSYGIMGALSLLVTYRIIKKEKRRLTE